MFFPSRYRPYPVVSPNLVVERRLLEHSKRLLIFVDNLQRISWTCTTPVLPLVFVGEQPVDISSSLITLGFLIWTLLLLARCARRVLSSSLALEYLHPLCRPPGFTVLMIFRIVYLISGALKSHWQLPEKLLSCAVPSPGNNQQSSILFLLHHYVQSLQSHFRPW